jgi:hypothetical protein
VSEHREANREPQHRDERCTAPHPARAFLLSLPAFAIAIAVVLLVWMFLL